MLPPPSPTPGTGPNLLHGTGHGIDQERAEGVLTSGEAAQLHGRPTDAETGWSFRDGGKRRLRHFVGRRRPWFLVSMLYIFFDLLIIFSMLRSFLLIVKK